MDRHKIDQIDENIKKNVTKTKYEIDKEVKKNHNAPMGERIKAGLAAVVDKTEEKVHKGKEHYHKEMTTHP